MFPAHGNQIHVNENRGIGLREKWNAGAKEDPQKEIVSEVSHEGIKTGVYRACYGAAWHACLPFSELALLVIPPYASSYNTLNGPNRARVGNLHRGRVLRGCFLADVRAPSIKSSKSLKAL
jgi:hypothetical protein